MSGLRIIALIGSAKKIYGIALCWKKNNNNDDKSTTLLNNNIIYDILIYPYLTLRATPLNCEYCSDIIIIICTHSIITRDVTVRVTGVLEYIILEYILLSLNSVDLARNRLTVMCRPTRRPPNAFILRDPYHPARTQPSYYI